MESQELPRADGGLVPIFVSGDTVLEHVHGYAIARQSCPTVKEGKTKPTQGKISTAHAGATPGPPANNLIARFASQQLHLFQALFPPWLVARSAYVLIFLPFLLGLAYVYVYGVNLGCYDPLSTLVPLIRKSYDGTLAFADLWAQQNEHRCLFAFLVALPLALVTHWNSVAEMYLVQLGLLAITVAYLYVFRDTCEVRVRPWLFVPIAFLVFSVRQYQTMLHAFGCMQAALETVAAFFCLYLLNRPRRVTAKFLGAVLFAVMCSYTSGQGLLVWPAGLLPILLAPLSKRQKTALATIWCAVAAVVSFFYFWGWVRPPYHPGPKLSFHYFAAIVGGALFPYPEVSIATIGGILLLLLSGASLVLTVNNGMARRYSFWLTIMLYGILVNAETSVGRGGFGTAHALASRYATFSLFTVVGLYAILSSLNYEKLTRLVPALWGAALALAVVGIYVSGVEGYEAAEASRRERDYHVFVFRTADTQPDEALPLAEWETGPVIRSTLQFLKEHKLNVYASPDWAARYAVPGPGLPETREPALADLHPLAVAKDTGLVTACGWAVNSAGDDLVGAVFLVIDDVVYPTYYGQPRDDVAKGLKNKTIKACGFQRQFSTRQLGAGPHRVALKVLTKDRTAWFRPLPPVEFTIAPAPVRQGT